MTPLIPQTLTGTGCCDAVRCQGHCNEANLSGWSGSQVLQTRADGPDIRRRAQSFPALLCLRRDPTAGTTFLWGTCLQIGATSKLGVSAQGSAGLG